MLASILSVFTFIFAPNTIRFNFSFYLHNISKFVIMPLFCMGGAATICFFLFFVFIKVESNITKTVRRMAGRRTLILYRIIYRLRQL